MAKYENKDGVGTFTTKSGAITVKVGDIFQEGERYRDRDSYRACFRFYTDWTYKVIAVHKEYVVIDYGHPEHLQEKLYPNLQTDYFTTIPTSQFEEQWDFDSYQPRYYMHVDGDELTAQPSVTDFEMKEQRKDMIIQSLDELVGREFSFVNSNDGQEMKFHNNYKIFRVHESDYEYHGHVIAEFDYIDSKYPNALQSGEIYKEENGMFRICFHDGWGSDNDVYFSFLLSENNNIGI